MKSKKGISLILLLSLSFTILAQEFILDAESTAIMHFNDTPKHVIAESPISSNPTFYANGISGTAASFYSSNNTKYTVLGNVQAVEGSFEAWIRPQWIGSDPNSRAIFSWGQAGGMLIEKDAAGYLKIIINRYGADPAGNEISVGYNISSWAALEWHHIACTWSSSAVELLLMGFL